ncbi:MAG: VCBS repeat-containing protein, partial [Bacteroidota bacterium]|nr:VCBS repeat-containing protein [Bacteroidota bacterium]
MKHHITMIKKVLFGFLSASCVEISAQSLEFTTQTLPFVGQTKCVVDMNGDFLDDVVKVSTTFITVARQTETGFSASIIPTDTANFTPSWSLAAGDLDRNGYNDLLYGSGGGTSFMIANENGTAYTERTGPEFVFSQRTNFIDINNDGHLDAFVCHDLAPNVYYMNDGEANLTFGQGGMGDTPDGGNYGSLWVDHDNDGDMDLFLSKCRGGDTPANINQLYRNNGDGTFTNIAPEVGLDDNIQTWSTAWGDYDNDGDMDMMVGAFSMVNGGHKLIRNDGNGIFTNITAGSGFDQLMDVGIENVTHDFDNDGLLDIFGAGDVIMLNNGDLTFTPVDVPMNNGPIGDLNNDGTLDIVNNNIAYMG